MYFKPPVLLITGVGRDGADQMSVSDNEIYADDGRIWRQWPLRIHEEH